jgi:TRAP-type C4-dicarboxylate transport system substrate-binding protein
VVYVPYLFKNKQVVPEIVNGRYSRSVRRWRRSRGASSPYGSRFPRHQPQRPDRQARRCKGLKLRVPPIEIIRATWEKLGAKPVV